LWKFKWRFSWASKASGNLKAASLRGSGSGAARTPRLWLPYAGITRIRFEGFSNLEISVRFTHTPSPTSIIGLLWRSVKSRGQPPAPKAGKTPASDWRELLLLANFFRGASSLVDYLFDCILGVGRRLIDLSTIPTALVIGKQGDSFFYASFDLVGFGIHWIIHLETKRRFVCC